MLHRLKYLFASHAFYNLSSKAIIGLKLMNYPGKSEKKNYPKIYSRFVKGPLLYPGVKTYYQTLQGLYPLLANRKV